MTKQNKADKVWAYLIKNPLALASEVAKAAGVSYGYAHKLKSKIGTPKEVFEMEAMRQRLEEDEEANYHYALNCYAKPRTLPVVIGTWTTVIQ
jgi:hypothetical protein